MFKRKDGTDYRLNVGQAPHGDGTIPLALALKPLCVSGTSQVATSPLEPRGKFLLHATKNPD